MLAKKITSKDNILIKNLRKLKQKKYRDKNEKFFVENFKIILDGYNFGFYPESLLITGRFFKKNKQKLEEILNKNKIKKYYLIDNIINKSFSALDTPSGVCGIYKKQKRKINLDESIVYLNGINDPGNLGTILRSAIAFDFKNVVMDENCSDLYNPKVIGSSKDAIFKINVEMDKNFSLLNKIKEKMKIFATSLEGDKEVSNLNKENIFCLVLGSESHGISEEVKKIADDFIKIDMSNNIESLNVAISSGIIFYSCYNKKL